MPTWDKTKHEVEQRRADEGPAVLDIVRRERMKAVSDYTKRPLVIYAVDFLNHSPKASAAGGDIQINRADKQGFVEVLEDLTGDKLDLLIHSPGGDLLAAESIVSLIRSKFSDVRVFVPDVAKSAATMIALSSNVIAMDERGELGPIDPQMVITSDQQTVISPAQAILDQFTRATQEIKKDPAILPAWLPLLRQYGPSLLVECRNQIDLSKKLVGQWLADYMFCGEADGVAKAAQVIEFFGEHNNFLSHGRMVSLATMPSHVHVLDLREDPTLRRLVWELYTAITLTFDSTNAYKIIENCDGQAFIKMVQRVQIVGPTANPQPPPGQTPVNERTPASPPQDRAPNRHDRRAAASRQRRQS